MFHSLQLFSRKQSFFFFFFFVTFSNFYVCISKLISFCATRSPAMTESCGDQLQILTSLLWGCKHKQHSDVCYKKTQRNCKTTEVNLFHCCTNRRLKYKRLCRSIIHICTITERLLSHTNAQLRSFDLLKMTPHVSSRSSLVLYTES